MLSRNKRLLAPASLTLCHRRPQAGSGPGRTLVAAGIPESRLTLHTRPTASTHRNPSSWKSGVNAIVFSQSC